MSASGVRRQSFCGSHPHRTQSIRQRKLADHRPETLANRAIEKPVPKPRSQQVSRKLALKNAEFREFGSARSRGRNEKPRTDWRLAGSYVQSETGFANVIGGDGGIRTLDPGFARMLP